MNESSEMKQIRALAENGDADAQFDMAWAHWWGNRGDCAEYVGYRLPEDRAKALEWYFKAAKQGHMLAQANLGTHFWCGEGGLLEDRQKAVEWYLKAAEQGDAGSQFWVGRAYKHGIGVQTNKTLANTWLLMAQKQGFPWATRELNDEPLIKS